MRILFVYRTHETSRIRVIGADLVVNLDQALLNNCGDFTAVQCVLQPVSEKNGERKRFPELVRPGRRTRSLEARGTGVETTKY